MIIYLDTCCLQRPLDDRSQPRINIEAEAILTILGLVENQQVLLVSSEVLEFEISRIQDEYRRTQVEEILSLASKHIIINDNIEMLANDFVNNNIKAVDALHLASAISYSVDYLCTTDDDFLNKAKRIKTSNTKVTSPLVLLTEVLK